MMIKLRVMAALAAALAVPAYAKDPTVTCKDGVAIASAGYDRVVLAHKAGRLDQAKTAAEGFWDLAGAFSDCSQVGALGGALTKLGYSRGIKANYGPSLSGTYTVSGQAGSVKFQELSVAIPKDAGVTVVDSKAVPSSLTVDGVVFQATAATLKK